VAFGAKKAKMNEIRTGQKNKKAVRRFKKMPFLPQMRFYQ